MNQSLNIVSNQSGVHQKLALTVRKHLRNPFQRPYAKHSLESFASIERRVTQHPGPLILDSYCGVGESTAHIALMHPQALVIGVDKSAHRLAKHAQNYSEETSANYLLLRADVDDFWRLAVDAKWQLSKHYILYPNPWPKSSQLKRRCHGSPLFPSIIALGGRLELRSNWATYVNEFALALQIAGSDGTVEQFNADRPITPFERKYSQSGHTLWRCCSEIGNTLFTG